MKRYITSIAAALAVLCFCINTLPASAAISPAPIVPNTGSSGLSITPRKDIHVSPGQTVSDKLTIGNLNGNADLNLVLKPVDFTFTDQSGTPKLLLADNAAQTAWSIKPFLKLPAQVTVKAGQSATVPYSISIPKNQGAGSYYSAIEYAATGGAGGNVALNASGVTLVFVSIPGTVHENMILQKFGAYELDKTKQSGRFIFLATSSQPDQIAYSLQNNGNVAEAPSGSISVKNMFGHEVANISNANINSSLALIGQTRLFTSCMKTDQSQVQFNGSPTRTITCASPKLLPGKYTANMDILYGQNGNTSQEITASASFWYLPWWFLAVLLVIVLIIAGAIFWLYRKFTNRTRSRSAGRRFRR